MRFLKEELYESSAQNGTILFDQEDVDFVTRLVSPIAKAYLSESNLRWNEAAGKYIEIKGEANNYCSVGCLNVSEELENKIEDYLVQKYGDIDISFNNTSTIFWAYEKY